MVDPWRKRLASDDLSDAFKEMTLIELSEFVKRFEETFGVTAAAPVAVSAAAPASGGGAGEAVEEKDEFDVVLEAAGDRKIQVIKVVREVVPGLGLKEAKDLVDSAPKAVLEKANQEAADKAKAALVAAGATVALVGGVGLGVGLVGAFGTGPTESRDWMIVLHVLQSLRVDSLLVARGVGSDVTRVERWMEGYLHPTAVEKERLGEFELLVRRFLAMWSPTLFPGWLGSPNVHLDGACPVDALHERGSDFVIAALEAASYGVYS